MKTVAFLEEGRQNMFLCSAGGYRSERSTGLSSILRLIMGYAIRRHEMRRSSLAVQRGSYQINDMLCTA